MDAGSYSPGYRSLMQLREIMTSGVVTAGADADVLTVAQLMRDHSVGSVVICDSEGEPAAMVTDRDLAVRALAEERSPERAGRRALPRGRWSPASRRWTSRRRRR